MMLLNGEVGIKVSYVNTAIVLYLVLRLRLPFIPNHTSRGSRIAAVHVILLLNGAYSAVTKAITAFGAMPHPYGASPRAWKPYHYSAVLQKLINSPHHVVPKEVAYAALEEVVLPEDATVDVILNSMAEYNLILLRTYSKMSRDIPDEAFEFRVTLDGGLEYEAEETVVAMPSPARFAAPLKMRNGIDYDCNNARNLQAERKGLPKNKNPSS